jgi:prophage regulatory protein
MKNFIDLPETGFLRLPAVLSLIPVSKSTWWAGVKSGRFPKPVKLGPRTTAWSSADISKLLQEFQTARLPTDSSLSSV